MFDRSRNLRRAGFLLAFASCVLGQTGCRTTGAAGGPPPPEDDGGGSGDGVGGGGAGSGPKIMGYQFFTRNSVSILRGKYSDSQENSGAETSDDLKNVKVTGKRYTLEHYPVVLEDYPNSDYGYALIEYRNETPDTDFWTERKTFLMLMGFVLPKWRLFAPVFGLHMEFNKISLQEEDSPEVAKSDIRATVLGVNFRQKLFGMSDWYAVYYQGRVHMLNLSFKSHGYEIEGGIGQTFQYSLLRAETTLGLIYQNYAGKRPDGDDGTLTVKSKYQSLYAMLSLWI